MFDFKAHFRAGLPDPAPRYAGLPPYNFVYGHNDPALVPTRELAAAAERIISREGDRLALYYMGGNPLGHAGLRAFLAAKIAARRGIKAEADDILITTGSLQGMDLVNQILVAPGDTVLIEAFTYGAAINKVKRLGGRVEAIPMDGQGIDPAGLERVLEDLREQGVRPKYIYTIPTVQNPTGTVLSLERRQALLALARRFEVPILEDECYSDLQWEGEAPPALYALDPERVIHIGSLSKSLAPALRIGYATARWEVLSQMLGCKGDAGSGALDQMVAAEYLEAAFDDHVEELKAGLQKKLSVLIEAVEREFGTSVEIFRPQGGIFLWLKFPDHIDVRSFHEAALAAGVAFNPGPEWACDAEAAKSYMRLCFALPTESDIEEGISVLAAVCHETTGLPARGANRERRSAR